MKQLVILSGKGGTGKTSVTAALAHLAAEENRTLKTVLADADVDAANLELVLAPVIQEEGEFRGGQIAVIDQDVCAGCGDCAQVCRFDAISKIAGIYQVDHFACDGCAACVYQCPEAAIIMQEQVAGKWYRSESRFGPLSHAELYPGGENSGKLVTLVKQYARLLAMDENRDLVLIDGPPGIGCPVISATSGADIALVVAEPTVSGVHDMHRALQTALHFGVPAMVCVNKADLYPESTATIEVDCRQKGIEYLGEIPYDPVVTDAMVQGEPVTAYRPDSAASQAIRQIWMKLKGRLSE